MSVWLIEPLDPLIARDGRPAAVGRFSTVPFPYPSMTAGAVRTRLGSEGGAFTLPADALEDLKKVEVRGPLLAKLNPETDEVLEWLVPAPRDAAVLREAEEKKPAIFALRPRKLEPGEAMDSLGEEGLLPLATSGEVGASKPPEGIPSFWRWEEMKGWLVNPADRQDVDLSSLGVRKLPVETRGNVALRPGERVGMDGMLFQTSGLRFLDLEKEDGPRFSLQRLVLSVGCPGGTVAGRTLALEEQIAPLGGERRLARWRQSSQAWPSLPEEVRESIVKNRRARLILLTPAIFSHGALPGWNRKEWPWGDTALKVKVSAACMPRPEVVSGWDLAAPNGDKPKGRPKHTRRLACAGSVYFVEIEGGSEADVRRWCEKTWLACVSDDVQEWRDGFGMVVLGTWEDRS